MRSCSRLRGQLPLRERWSDYQYSDPRAPKRYSDLSNGPAAPRRGSPRYRCQTSAPRSHRCVGTAGSWCQASAGVGWSAARPRLRPGRSDSPGPLPVSARDVLVRGPWRRRSGARSSVDSCPGRPHGSVRIVIRLPIQWRETLQPLHPAEHECGWWISERSLLVEPGGPGHQSRGRRAAPALGSGTAISSERSTTLTHSCLRKVRFFTTCHCHTGSAQRTSRTALKMPGLPPGWPSASRTRSC